MRKLIIGLISVCFIFGSGTVVWSVEPPKPVLKQKIQRTIPVKTKNKKRLPELYITSIQSSSKILPGKKIPALSITVKNGGTAAARGNQIKKSVKGSGYLLTVSISGEITCKLMTIRDTPTLNPGQSKVFKLHNTITIPRNLTPGRYTLLVTIDPDNSIPELKESNNTSQKRIEIKSPFLPDLKVSAAGSSEAIVGSRIPHLDISVRNIGNTVAKGVPTGTLGSQVVGYFISVRLFSLDQPSSSGQSLKMVSTTPDIQPGQDHGFALGNNLLIPANTPPGNYQVQVMVDPVGKVAESNEANNMGTHNIRINAETPAELTVSISSLPTSIKPGKTIPTCSIVVSNTGPKTAVGGNNGFSIILAISSSTSIPPGIPGQGSNFTDGMLLHKIWYPSSLQHNQSNTYQIDNLMRLPADAPSGTYNIIAVVDPENKIPEIDETNNSVFKQVSVPDKPDLTVTSIVNVSSNTIEVVIKNKGGRLPDFVYDVNSGASMQYYVDNQPRSGFSFSMIDPSRVLQTPGGTVTKTFGSQLFCTENPGHHIVAFEVDPGGVIDESDEGNNALSMSIECP